MNAGLLLKSLRESWFVTVICAVGVLLMEIVFTRVIPTFPKEMLSQMLQLNFFQHIFRSFLGADIDIQLGPHVMIAMAWVHPVMLSMVFAQCITHFTAMPALEIERGTIDPLLGQPISRWSLFGAQALVGLAGGALLVACVLVGFLIGNLVNAPEDRPTIGEMLITAVNLFAVYIAVAGFAGLIAACTNRRGRAVAATFAVVLASFLFNSLEQFWPMAKTFSFISVLNYYRPATVFRNGAWPTANILALVGVGLAFWTAGGIVFSTRDIRTD